MIVVAGPLHVDPSERDRYLADCQDLIRQAPIRSAAVWQHQVASSERL